VIEYIHLIGYHKGARSSFQQTEALLPSQNCGVSTLGGIKHYSQAKSEL